MNWKKVLKIYMVILTGVLFIFEYRGIQTNDRALYLNGMVTSRISLIIYLFLHEVLE